MRGIPSPMNDAYVCACMCMVFVGMCQCVGFNTLHTTEATMLLHLLSLLLEMAQEFPILVAAKQSTV